MRYPLLLMLLIAGIMALAAQDTPAQSGPYISRPEEFLNQVSGTINRHLGKPYAWGESGLKSFDCSGFVWRVMYESGILIKRTSARKLYLSLPKVSEREQWHFGNIVFFDNLKHCGIINSRTDFYHADCKKGTTLSLFAPHWQDKLCGVRGVPKKSGSRNTL